MLLQTDKIIKQRAHLIYLITGKDHTDRAAYYYLLVDKPRVNAFLKAFEQPDDMELTDYGRLLFSGYGAMPPESVQNELQTKYGNA